MSKKLWGGLLLFFILLPLASGVSETYAASVGATLEQALASPSTAYRLPSTLSPHWSYKVQRWSALIAQEAERRHLDSDLLASLIWKESRGDAWAEGPAGAVGLMQVMPKERGFSWRPSRELLLDPGVNLYWGARTLSIVIRQGHGDVFSALAAYNGGWERIHKHGPRRFASEILHDYASAVAARHGVDGPWIAFLAVQDLSLHGPIWVADSAREDLYLYGEENHTPGGAPLVPAIPPTTVAARCVDEETGSPYIVGLWLYQQAQQQWIAGPPLALGATASIPSRALALAPETSQAAAPVLSLQSAPVQSPATSEQAAAPTATSVPDISAASVAAGAPDAVNTPGSSGSPALVAASQHAPVQTGCGSSVGMSPSIPFVPLLPQLSCAGGPLRVDTWPLDKRNTHDGWRVRIFAEAHGGACTYTYAWNDEENVVGSHLTGPHTFEVGSSDRSGNIIGTVVVMSGGETVRVPLYITPPGD